MRRIQSGSLLICLFLLSLAAFSQDYPHDVKQYSFVKYDINKLDFYGNKEGFENLFERFDKILFEGEGNIQIVHMGGSHIQAGIFSSQMRKHLQEMQQGLNAYRGYFFPYKMAGTNNPFNYKVKYSGRWESCRNVEKNRSCNLGLSGISVTTYDTTSYLEIVFDKEYMDYDYTVLKVFHNTDSSSFTISPKEKNYTATTNYHLGYTEFKFAEPQDTVFLDIIKTDSLQNFFQLYGLSAETEYPGFIYHAIGVNGADVPSYLRCKLLASHVEALKPDVFIFSIGINDAYTTRFSPQYYKSNYDSLIKTIKSVAPDVSIIFTTNNDSYYRKRYVNKNGEKVREAMIELAKKHDAAVWDLFSIMGGLNSIRTWEQYGLAKRDKIHFTKEGYILAGDLFFSALMKSYEDHLTSINPTK